MELKIEVRSGDKHLPDILDCTNVKDFCCMDFYNYYDPERNGIPGMFEVDPVLEDKDIPANFDLNIHLYLSKERTFSIFRRGEQDVMIIDYCPFCGEKIDIKRIEVVEYAMD